MVLSSQAEGDLYIYFSCERWCDWLVLVDPFLLGKIVWYRNVNIDKSDCPDYDQPVVIAVRESYLNDSVIGFHLRYRREMDRSTFEFPSCQFFGLSIWLKSIYMNCHVSLLSKTKAVIRTIVKMYQ